MKWHKWSDKKQPKEHTQFGQVTKRKKMAVEWNFMTSQSQATKALSHCQLRLSQSDETWGRVCPFQVVRKFDRSLKQNGQSMGIWYQYLLLMLPCFPRWRVFSDVNWREMIEAVCPSGNAFACHEKKRKLCRRSIIIYLRNNYLQSTYTTSLS